MAIEGNKDIIERLNKGINNGTIRNTRSLHSVIEGERSRQNNDYYNNVDVKRRQESTGTIGDLALRQPTDSRGSVGDLGTELHKSAPAEHTDRGAGRVDDILYRQDEDIPHTATSSESKSKPRRRPSRISTLAAELLCIICSPHFASKVSYSASPQASAECPCIAPLQRCCSRYTIWPKTA